MSLSSEQGDSPRTMDTVDALIQLADLVEQGAIYLGRRIDGRNDEFTYESMIFKLPSGDGR